MHLRGIEGIPPKIVSIVITFVGSCGKIMSFAVYVQSQSMYSLLSYWYFSK